MLAKLDTLARSHSPVPGICIRMLPYLPMYWTAQNLKLIQHIGEENWTGLCDVFMQTCPLITSLTTTGETLPIPLAALALWYEGRTGDVVEDWTTFEQICSNETLNILWATREAIRSELAVPRAADVLQQPAPVPVLEDGMTANPTTASGGRRFRKK